jgi:hypothetical protein
MDQPVAKGDDPAAVANPVEEVRVQAEGLSKSFPYYFESSLHRRSQESLSGVISEGFSAGELGEQVTRLCDIEQLLAHP